MAPDSYYARDTSTCPPPPTGPTLFCDGISGTSQAAPIIAGMYARCYSCGKCTTSMNASQLLQQVLQPTKDYNLLNKGYGFKDDAVRVKPEQSLLYYGYLVWGGTF